MHCWLKQAWPRKTVHSEETIERGLEPYKALISKARSIFGIFKGLPSPPKPVLAAAF